MKFNRNPGIESFFTEEQIRKEILNIFSNKLAEERNINIDTKMLVDLEETNTIEQLLTPECFL